MLLNEILGEKHLALTGAESQNALQIVAPFVGNYIE